jgi:hypothetical protein
MGARFVVGPHPSIGDLPDLIQVLEEVGVQHLLAIGAVEAFDVRVLVRLPGLDVADLDAPGAAPVLERLGHEFRPVVPTEWAAVDVRVILGLSPQPEEDNDDDCPTRWYVRGYFRCH